MKILLTDDLVINKEYSQSSISDSVITLFKQSDLNIVNLEGPITSSTSKILKTGPHLKSHKESTQNILKDLDVDIVTLANNHVLDYDEEGVADTLEFCHENKIRTVGAGNNLEEASKTLYFDSAEGKIAIVNFAENEWSSATEKTAGANPMDIIDNAKQIKEAKQSADYVFVIVHGGHEYYNLPSPRMQKQYRFYADQGADAIICHHTHIISGYEEYKNVPIAYGLGNFLFTLPYKYEGFHNGVIAELTVTKNDPIQFKPQFVKQDSNSHYLSFCKEDTLLTIKQEFLDISNQIKNRIFLEEKWNEFINSKSNTYLQALSGYSLFPNKYLRFVLKRLGFSLINKNKAKILLNHIRCESHRELSIEVLKRYLYEKNK